MESRGRRGGTGYNLELSKDRRVFGKEGIERGMWGMALIYLFS